MRSPDLIVVGRLVLCCNQRSSEARLLAPDQKPWSFSAPLNKRHIGHITVLSKILTGQDDCKSSYSESDW